MWCSTCGQDVPVVAADAGISVCCVRCGEPIRSAVSADATPELQVIEAACPISELAVAAGMTGGLDDWELGQKLRDVEHVLRRSAPEGSQAADEATTHYRLDAAHEDPTTQHAVDTSKSVHLKVRTRPTSRAAMPKPSLLAWGAIALGLATVSCGLALLGWSQLTGRDDLWSLGIPIALAGLFGLMIGLVLELEQFWQSHRELSKRLDEVKDEPRSSAGRESRKRERQTQS